MVVVAAEHKLYAELKIAVCHIPFSNPFRYMAEFGRTHVSIVYFNGGVVDNL